LVEIRGEEFYGVGYEDSSRLPPDVTKLRALGWAPRHDVRSTFRDAMAFYLAGFRAGRLLPVSLGNPELVRAGGGRGPHNGAM
jgi:hypothetical protein